MIHDAEIVDAEADLPELAARANKFHAAAEGAATSALEAAWHCGVTLLAAKDQCEHGTWLPWLEGNFAGSQQSASNYMRLAANYQSTGNLAAQSIDAALKAISRARDGDAEAKPKPNFADVFQKRLDVMERDATELIGSKITPARARKLADAIAGPRNAIDELFEWLTAKAK